MELAIYGYGGHAREVAAQILQCTQYINITFFVDDEYANEFTKPISEFEWYKYMMIVAVADSKHRYDIVQRLPKGTRYHTFIHPTALLMDKNIEIGEGSFIGANSILTTNIKLGKHAILNRGVQIGHDTEIGDYFSAMPGVVISGNVKIHDCVYIGTNSSVKEKISIHSSTTIGLNSGVLKSIEKPGVYAGTPTKLIK